MITRKQADEYRNNWQAWLDFKAEERGEILGTIIALYDENNRLKEANEKLRKVAEAAKGLSYGTDWNNGTHAIKHGYRASLLEALAALEGVLVQAEDYKTMKTPEERAEKIYDTYGRKGSWNLFDKKMIDAIAAEIREATDEAYKKGFSDAIKKAAKITEGHSSGDIKLCNDGAHDDRYCGTCEAMRDEADIISQKIRALKPQ